MSKGAPKKSTPPSSKKTSASKVNEDEGSPKVSITIRFFFFKCFDTLEQFSISPFFQRKRQNVQGHEEDLEDEPVQTPRHREPRKELKNLQKIFPEKTHEIMQKKIVSKLNLFKMQTDCSCKTKCFIFSFCNNCFFFPCFQFEAHETPKKRIPFNVWRCPYCLFLHQKKCLVVEHIDDQHAEYVNFERNTVFDTAARMENLAGAGPRIMDEVKFDAHLQTLSAKFNRQDMAAIRDVTKNILFEALVEVGDETTPPSNRYVAWKKRFEALQ